MKKEDFSKNKKEDLVKQASDLKKNLRENNFDLSGSKETDKNFASKTRKKIARILTELNMRAKKEKETKK